MSDIGIESGTVKAAVVLYHYSCHDGIFAALAAWQHFTNAGIPVRFVPHMVYRQLDIQQLSLQPNETAYLLDYVGPPGFAHQLAAVAAEVVVLDHHKTALEQFETAQALPNLQVMIMKCSGAKMALDYFQPPELSSNQRRLFEYVDDADLWRWQLPQSKEFHAGLVNMRLEYDANSNPDIFDQLLALSPEELIAEGRHVIAEQTRVINGIIAQSFPVQLGGQAGKARGWPVCLAVRGDAATDLRSQIGNALAAKSQSAGLAAMAAVAYAEADMHDASRLKVSLRSMAEEDTTVISSDLGGGGHKNASSFLVDAADFESWRT